MAHQSKYVNLKVNMSRTGAKPDELAAWILGPSTDAYGNETGLGQPNASVLYAIHDEPGKELHFHMVVRFAASGTRWDRLFRHVREEIDEHAYCEPARAYTRSARYLLHLDNPEKEPIARSCLKTFNVDESELAMLLGAPRTCILHDIRDLGNRGTFSAFDWLVNERGHSPNEVTQVMRCLATISEWVKRVKEDESILDSAEELNLADEFVDPNPFDESSASRIREDFDFG